MSAQKPSITGRADLWVSLQIVRDAATQTTSSTRAMNVPGGCIIRTSMRGPGISTEALVFVPHAQVRKQRDQATGVLVTIP
jgi:hypothetical protein